MKYTEKGYRELADRVTGWYAALGREALTKMTTGELSVLYAEVSVSARIAANIFRKDGSELNSLLKEKADDAVVEIGEYIRETQQKDRGPELER